MSPPASPLITALIMLLLLLLLLSQKEYLARGKQWLHVDIAGPAWADDRGTGYGVALLSELVDALQSSSG